MRCEIDKFMNSKKCSAWREISAGKYFSPCVLFPRNFPPGAKYILGNSSNHEETLYTFFHCIIQCMSTY